MSFIDLCPFCGKDIGSVITVTVTIIYPPKTWYYVQCANCKACGPATVHDNEAIELWQKRYQYQERKQ